MEKIVNNRILNNTKKIIKICNEINIIPIIFGSVGYFLRTFDFEMLQEEGKEIGFNDLDFIVSQLELKILKNEFINLGYSLDLTWIDGYVGFVKGDKDNPYTIEDTSGIEIGPKRFELELDGFIYDFDALDEFVELDENTNIMVDGLMFKIASINVLKECLKRELDYGWANSNEKQKLERLSI